MPKSIVGVCLGFDVPDHLLVPMIYTDKPMKIAGDGKSSLPKLSESFVNALLRTKYVAWRHEDEYRIFVQLDHKAAESGLYFYSFSSHLVLREVILGPRCEMPMRGIRELVVNFDPQICIIKSRLAFTKFKVVENKIATRSKPKA